MDINCNTPTETTTSPEDGQSEEAIGVISQAYRNIFVNGEKLLVKVNDDNINKNNPSSFRHNPIQESGYSQSHPHPNISSQEHSIHSTTSCLPQSRCPVTNHNNKPTTHVMDNSHYNFPQSSSPHSPSQGTTPPQSYPSKHNNYSTQTSCPWRLSPGAKVLVCLYVEIWFVAGLGLQFCVTITYVTNALFLCFSRHVLSMHAPSPQQVTPVNRSGRVSPSASLQLLKKWLNLPRAFQGFRPWVNMIRSCCWRQEPFRWETFKSVLRSVPIRMS